MKMPIISLKKPNTPPLCVNLYSTKRRIFGEVHVFSDRVDHYMQRHVSRFLHTDKSKVAPDVDDDFLITETLNYGVPVGFTDGHLELRLHFRKPIGYTGYGNEEAYYTVLILKACNGQWRFINFFVDRCPFSGTSKVRKCPWKHCHSEKVKLSPNVERDFDILDRTVLYQIKRGCLDRYGSYNYEQEGISKRYFIFSS